VSDIDDYLATLPSDQRAELERIRKIVADAAPDAEEGRSYGIPAFRFGGKPLLGFRAAKQHLSVHPFSPAVVEGVRDRLEDYDLAKGTIRFTAEHPLPEDVIRELVALRLAELR
jgi:uncharacterized protein YdhG (YjbR/CyaY superfamily)